MINCKSQNTPSETVTIEQETAVDETFETYQKEGSPGLAIAILKKNQVIFQKGYGLANLEKEERIVPEESVFALASVSKQFTVMAILLLEERGKLSLEDDIRKYIPELHDFGNKISLKHLASNTSGYRSDLQLLGMKGFTNDDAISRTVVNEVIFNQKELNFKPGAEFRYSNSGFALLAEVVERVSGKPFSSFMEAEIFKPLGMHQTFVMDDLTRTIEHLAPSYAFYNDTFVSDPLKYSFVGSTGIFTTLTDFVKWAKNFEDHTIGNGSIFDKMNAAVELNNGTSAPYALGQFIEVYNGMDQIQHGGGSASYRTYIGRFPNEEFTVLLLSNVGNINIQKKAMEVVDVFLTPEKQANKKEKEEVLFINLPANKLTSLEGNFIHPLNNYTRKIELRNDTLRYIRTEQNNRESVLLPIDETTFQLGNYTNTRITFNTEGTKSTMEVEVDGKVEDRLEKYESKEYPKEELQQFTGTYFSDELHTSYEISLLDKILEINHPKMRTIQLFPIMEDVFLTNSWRFAILKIQRAKDTNEIVGFRISSDRVRNVLFNKKK